MGNYGQGNYGQWNKPMNSLIKVTGLDGAKAYQVPPNSSVALFDGDSDTFFVKTTDENGFPTLRAFRFEEVPLENFEQGNTNETQRQIAECCCTTQRAIDGVNFNMAEQTQKVLDAITTNRMADMQNQINQLQLQSALCGVVRWPQQATWNGGQVPFFGNNCGCGCGCNNI